MHGIAHGAGTLIAAESAVCGFFKLASRRPPTRSKDKLTAVAKLENAWTLGGESV